MNIEHLKSFRSIFALLSSTQPENQHFEKMRKEPGDIILLHMCNINENHMMYDSWDMECDRQKFLSIWDFYSPNNPENQNFEKTKKPPIYI